MSPSAEAAHVELVRAHATDCWSRGVYDHLEERFTFDVAVVTIGRERRGTEVIREQVEAIRERLQDLELSIDDVVATGSTATVHWTCRGRPGPATADAQPVAFAGKAHVTFEDGRISMLHGFPDQLQVLRAAGGLV